MSGVIAGIITVVGGAIMIAIGKIVIKQIKRRRARNRILDNYSPDLCIEHRDTLKEVKSNHEYLKEFANVMLAQQYADYMRRTKGAVNGEQVAADEALITFMLKRTEFKIG